MSDTKVCVRIQGSTTLVRAGEVELPLGSLCALWFLFTLSV